MLNRRTKQRRGLSRVSPPAARPMQRPAVYGASSRHAFVRSDDNARLYAYEEKIKGGFARIEPCLQAISQLQHDADFVRLAQRKAIEVLGFELPEAFLKDTWIKPLDIGRIYAWCVFKTFRMMSDEFFTQHPLAGDDEAFQAFIEECGFHLMDVSPCADGRLAHVIRYVLRLPYRSVRRKSFAGAMFDVDDSLAKWTEVEMQRFREGKPNLASDPTRYLKVAVYHYSSGTAHEGCAAHGSDVNKASQAAWNRLKAFRQGVENTYCCGASIDLLLIGLDTDTDAIRLHLPDVDGDIDTELYIDAAEVYARTQAVSVADAEAWMINHVSEASSKAGIRPASDGMVRLAARLLLNNLSQIDYVRTYHNGSYSDVGHQESFIGMGIGFEEIQLRNLTYFAYLSTVEEGAADLDVGIKIFTGLNISRGLPVPVVIRCDYHACVPGARERAVARCKQLDNAFRDRYRHLVEKDMLHTLLMVRDCENDSVAEKVSCSAMIAQAEMH